MKKIAVFACLFAASMICSPVMAQAPPGDEAVIILSNELASIAADRAAPTDHVLIVERAGVSDELAALVPSSARSTGSLDSASIANPMTDLDRADDALHRRGSVRSATGFSVA